jgi:DNA-binding GntR family transcriptional regulator
MGFLGQVRPGKTRLQLSVRPITLVDQIAEALIETAAAGRILPGDRVVEVEVARELNISRVPVREALRLLQSQGIVVNMPYKGMRLMDVTPKKIHELLIVRAGLERIAAREAVPLYRRDTEVFAPIYAALEDMRHATIDGNGLAHARADIAFHRAICQACGNEVLLEIWETLSRKLTIIFGLAALPTRLDYVYKEHVVFFEILKSSNPAALDQAVDDHVIRSTEEIDFDRLIAERRKNH